MLRLEQLTEEQQQLLLHSDFFAQITAEQLQQILPCLGVSRSVFSKSSYLFHAGDQMPQLGLLLSGKIQIVQEDFWGNRTILEQINAGGYFGEAFVCANTKKIPVNVLAAEEADVLFIPYQKVLTVCSNTCSFHQQLIMNLLHSMAAKNVLLVQKMTHITKRSTREKLLSYLSVQALQQGTNQFTIPFNRQELADFLAVERSAMSAELSRMQKEGLLEFHRNSFRLHAQDGKKEQ